MIKCCFFFVIVARLFSSFQDEELQHLWSQIADINQPTLEEYQLIERYLKSGERPYLDLLRKSDRIEFYRGRMESILNLRLVGPNNRIPLYEKYDINPDIDSHRRCIVLFGTSNGIYPEKARQLLREIKESGYCGHVLFRIGGFPNTEFGGLKICHVPYSFKVAFLQEAKTLGYKELLWIDLAIHPLNNFETVFWEIANRGFFFTTVGTLEANRLSHLPKAAEALDITPDIYDQIPHISSSMIGLNIESEQAAKLLEAWYAETEKVIPSMTWWPEELSLSVAAWRLGCKPYCAFGDFVCGESEQFQLEKRPSVQFYLDARR